MRSFFFKYRGVFFIPVALTLILLGKPTLLSFSIGIIVAFMGEAIRIWGVGYAGVTTRKDTADAPYLVTGGPYAIVRNPLYIGNALTGLGFVIAVSGACPLWMILVFIILWAVCYFGVYGMIIPYEEEFLEKMFGEPYKDYCSKVNRIIPNFKLYPNPSGSFDIKAVMEAESRTVFQFIAFAVVIALKIIPFGPLVGRLFFS